MLLYTEAGDVPGFFWDTLIEFTGGDFIFIGIGIFILFAIILTITGVRSGPAIVIGVSLAYVLSIFAPEFAFVFWIAILVGIFMMVQGFRRQSVGN